MCGSIEAGSMRAACVGEETKFEGIVSGFTLSRVAPSAKKQRKVDPVCLNPASDPSLPSLS